MKPSYGLEQARAQLPRIAAEAHAGHTSVITRHGKPMAAVVPLVFLRAQQANKVRKAGILALRGTGRHLWPEGAAQAVAGIRDEWQS